MSIQQGKLGMIDYSGIQAIPEIWPIVSQRFGKLVALQDPHGQPKTTLTFAELSEKIQQFARGIQFLNIQAREHVALFADNSPRWFIADQGLMTAGVVDAVRGSQADRDELLYILTQSNSVALIVQDLATLKKLSPDLQTLAVPLVVILTDEEPPTAGFKILNFSQVMDLGRESEFVPVVYDRSQLATLMYTSGTSGMPKGVMLSHGNLMSQVVGAPAVVQPQPGDSVLSILPIWHSYERSFEYFTLSQGCCQIYTNIRSVKKDLKTYQPEYMVAVPRLWESIYEGVQKQFRDQPASKQRLIQTCFQISQAFIQARRIVQGLALDNLNPSSGERLVAWLKLLVLTPLHSLCDRIVYQQVRAATGGKLKYVVSGGGSIAEFLEDFYEIVGIDVLGGYGLTETSPITHVRRPQRNLRGADGQPIPGTQTRIVDLETRQDLPVGAKGLVLLKGPQVMQGYYQNPEATAKAIDVEGWFDSGDLGCVTAWDDLIITGRAKDTIVLTNGENIEPQPIENACLRSPYVDQVMLVGQDQKSLGALIVPQREALQQWAAGLNRTLSFPETETVPGSLTLESQEVLDLFRKELNREVQNRPGYRPDDRIGPIRLIAEAFSVENGLLTQTLKIRRPVVMERYQGMINKMFEE